MRTTTRPDMTRVVATTAANVAALNGLTIEPTPYGYQVPLQLDRGTVDVVQIEQTVSRHDRPAVTILDTASGTTLTLTADEAMALAASLLLTIGGAS